MNWTNNLFTPFGFAVNTLTAFKDRAHLESAQAAMAKEPMGPMPTPAGRGVKLLEPSHFSTLR